MIRLLLVLIACSTCRGGSLRSKRDDGTIIFEEWNESCITPHGLAGTCIPWTECETLTALFQCPTRAAIDYVQLSACTAGKYYAPVCCPPQVPIIGPMKDDICYFGPNQKPKPPPSAPAKPSPSAPVKPPPPAPAKPPAPVPATPPAAPRPPSAPQILQPVKLPEQCGVTSVVRLRIVGGQESPLNGWPWIAALGYRNPENESEIFYGCGGTLVTDQHIVTAGHCINAPQPLVSVRLGEHDTSRDDDGAEPIDFEVLETRTHPEFARVGKNPINDVAIIKLKQKVTFTKKIAPICLPVDPVQKANDLVGTKPYVAGWGKTAFFSFTFSPVLREVQLPIIAEEDCRNAYLADKNSPVIDEKFLCAGFLGVGKKDACQADSGGPLMLADDHEIFTLVGIVSFGRGCADPKYPGVYSRVTHYIDWILANLN